MGSKLLVLVLWLLGAFIPLAATGEQSQQLGGGGGEVGGGSVAQCERLARQCGGCSCLLGMYECLPGRAPQAGDGGFQTRLLWYSVWIP